MEKIKKILLETAKFEKKGLYNYNKKFERYINKIDNKNLLNYFLELRLKNISIKRICNLTEIYNKFLKGYDLKKIDDTDFRAIYLNILNSDLSNSSKITYLKGVKQILRFFELEIDYSKYRIKEEKKPLMSEDLLTEDEKHYIIENIKTLKHKVFFTILFDTGLRVGEVYSINRNSFKKVEKGYLITINESKTQIRSVFTYSHNHYIEKLLKTNWFSWDFSYRTTYNIIKRFEKKLNKRLYHHLARHSKATELAQHLTEQELKNYFGWSPDSKMLNNYVHLNNNKIIKKLQNSISNI